VKRIRAPFQTRGGLHVIALSQLNSDRRGGGRFVVAVVAALAEAPAAFAADVLAPTPAYTKAPVVAPAYSWAGFYLGADLGGAWGRQATTLTPIDGPGENCHFCVPGDTDAGALNALGSSAFNTSSAAFGVRGGYNTQVNSWVLGIESDFTSVRLRKSVASAGNPFRGGFAGFVNFSTNVSTDWLVTVRPRIGYALDRTLFYVTGGLAFAHLGIAQDFSDLAPGIVEVGHEQSSASAVKTGWTVGGGAEYAITQAWIVNAEYLYANLGSVKTAGTVTANSTTATLPFTLKTELHEARFGIAYKFGP
jgi:outer membrane immunogenic protein